MTGLEIGLKILAGLIGLGGCLAIARLTKIEVRLKIEEERGRAFSAFKLWKYRNRFDIADTAEITAFLLAALIVGGLIYAI